SRRCRAKITTASKTMINSQFHGRHVLITGAGSGIGAAIAREFAAQGANVTLAGRRHEPLSALDQELDQATGRKACFIASGFDVTDVQAIQNGLQAAKIAFGPVNILINNAGEAPSASFEKTSLEMWSQVLAVDLTGVFQVTQAVLPD